MATEICWWCITEAEWATIQYSNATLHTSLNENEQANGTYAIMTLAKSGEQFFAVVLTIEQHGNVDSFEVKDITHAISGRIKREDWSATKAQPFRENSYALPQSSSITISDFLDIVNETYRSVLSDNGRLKIVSRAIAIW